MQLGHVISPPMIEMFDGPCIHMPWLTTFRSVTYFTVPGELSRAYTYNPFAAQAAALRKAAETAPPVTD